MGHLYDDVVEWIKVIIAVIIGIMIIGALLSAF